MPIRGPALYTQAPGFDFDGVGRGFKSWYTDCDMSYVNCVPEDNFQVIFTCNGLEATVGGANQSASVCYRYILGLNMSDSHTSYSSLGQFTNSVISILEDYLPSPSPA
jgi:hypothetical protein